MDLKSHFILVQTNFRVENSHFSQNFFRERKFIFLLNLQNFRFVREIFKVQGRDSKLFKLKFVFFKPLKSFKSGKRTRLIYHEISACPTSQLALSYAEEKNSKKL